MPFEGSGGTINTEGSVVKTLFGLAVVGGGVAVEEDDCDEVAFPETVAGCAAVLLNVVNM